MSIAIEHDVPEPVGRPRRRGLTPLTGGLAAVIVGAGGFIGGVQLQKSQGATTAAATRPAGGPPGMTAAGGGASDAATTGTVEYANGNVLYVKDSDGNTIKVKIKSSSDVTRTASTDAETIQPGDSVVVQGAANDNGTVAATAVTATEAAGA